MSVETPLSLIRDQFKDLTPSRTSRRWRKTQLAVLLVPLAVAGGCWYFRPVLTHPEALLTPVTVLTGFMFTSALTFWNKSIDMRLAPRVNLRGDTLNLLDRARIHMQYTVAIGIVTVLAVTLVILFAGAVPDRWLWLPTMVIGALTSYFVTLAAGFMSYFQRAFLAMRP